MANSYYDSQLTAAEIEAALEAVDGVITPENNGKVLAVENGAIVARSVTEWVDLKLQTKTVTPGAIQQTVVPDSGYNGLESVTVNGDTDLVAGNIKKNVEIFGVTGSYEGSAQPVLQSKTATENGTVLPDTGYDGLSSVVVNVSGGSINLQTKTVTQNGVVTADSGFDGLSQVTVNVPGGETAYTSKASLNSVLAHTSFQDEEYNYTTSAKEVET